MPCSDSKLEHGTKGFTGRASDGLPRPLLAISLGLSVVLTVGCGANGGTGKIDGFPLGNSVNCSASMTAWCDELVALGRQALDQRDPGHAAVDTSRVYEEGPLPTGMVRSGTLRVVVFGLADGSTHATAVVCGSPPCVPLMTYPGP